MDRSRAERLNELVKTARGLPEESRLFWLERAASDEPELIEEALDTLGIDRAHTIDSREGAPTSRAGEIHALFEPGGAPEGAIFGPFELRGELGRGGMGVVYRALDGALGREVAVKVLLPSLGGAPEGRRRFEQEARRVARLKHPGLVTVHGVGQEGGVPWFSMELVEGETLRARIDRWVAMREKEAAYHPPFSEAVEIVRDLADALVHAHEEGVIHRDIKPQNVLFDAQGRPRLVDFGIARDELQAGLTTSGQILGTPHYMSPEQAGLDPTVTLDERTDVYALGVVLFEMLTLQVPFDAQSAVSILVMIDQRDAPRVRSIEPRVARDLAIICETAMAHRPADRYASVAELRDDLNRFLDREAIRAKPPTMLDRAARHVSRRRVLYGAAAAVLGAGVSGAWIRSHLAERAQLDRLVVRVRGADGQPKRARIRVLPFDPIREVVHAPIIDRADSHLAARLDSGWYRIIVNLADERQRESLEQARGDGGRIDLEASFPNAADEVRHEMVRIDPPPGWWCNRLGYRQSLPAGGPAALTPFLFDRYEVSNGAFLAFMLATGHRPPASWPGGIMPPAAADLPVCGVSHRDASAYALWAGLRLPTRSEWYLATRGPELRRFPWGEEPRGLPANVHRPRRREGRRATPDWARCFEEMEPVTAGAEGASLEHDLRHALGNVREWTDSPFIDFVDGEPRSVDAQRRYSMGGSIRAVASENGGNADLVRTVLLQQVSDPGRSPYGGFRCARSILD